jgi:hypothetical protein
MYTAHELKIYFSIVASLLKEFSNQKMIPTQPEVLKAMQAVEKIVDDDLALKLLAACLEDMPKEVSEKIAAEAAARAVEEGIKAAKAAALLKKRNGFHD